MKTNNYDKYKLQNKVNGCSPLKPSGTGTEKDEAEVGGIKKGGKYTHTCSCKKGSVNTTQFYAGAAMLTDRETD